jgi:catechol 2,3-dioxygenase-like lactoylglutathione lyase family enzyme
MRSRSIPINRLDHVDLAVRDVERSLEFSLGILGPLGMAEALRFPTDRGIEEVVYLGAGGQFFGPRQADGGKHGQRCRSRPGAAR